MASTPKTSVDVELVPVEATDLLWVAENNFKTFPTFYEPLFTPASSRPPHDVLVQRFAKRLEPLISSPHILAIKAVLASGPEKGKAVGHTLWHRPGAPVRNMKRPFPAIPEEEKENWDGTDVEKWETKWAGWDATRARIMGDIPHWYIAPIWIIPEYQGQGIGRKLMQQVIDLADQHTPSQPIFLEASKDGQPMYEKLGFVVEGGSEYVEMVRWGKNGERREESGH
ncbi:hypothetical protein JCM10213_002245 [Rhodosporidiobolus nylandii]